MFDALDSRHLMILSSNWKYIVHKIDIKTCSLLISLLRFVWRPFQLILYEYEFYSLFIFLFFHYEIALLVLISQQEKNCGTQIKWASIKFTFIILWSYWYWNLKIFRLNLWSMWNQINHQFHSKARKKNVVDTYNCYCFYFCLACLQTDWCLDEWVWILR